MYFGAINVTFVLLTADNDDREMSGSALLWLSGMRTSISYNVASPKTKNLKSEVKRSKTCKI